MQSYEATGDLRVEIRETQCLTWGKSDCPLDNDPKFSVGQPNGSKKVRVNGRSFRTQTIQMKHTKSDTRNTNFSLKKSLEVISIDRRYFCCIFTRSSLENYTSNITNQHDTTRIQHDTAPDNTSKNTSQHNTPRVQHEKTRHNTTKNE